MVREAEPEITLADPIDVDPSWKVTVPLGAFDPVVGFTNAVKVTEAL